jgi:endonuclease/exonuclease/phosphatase family metal-dependent hydrolase
MIAWNIAQRNEAWRSLLDTDADIALLQEAPEPPADVGARVHVDQAPWRTAGAGTKRPWRTVIARLSDRVSVQWLETKTVEEAAPGELAVSRSGTLSAAVVTPSTGESFIAVALYAAWERPHGTTGGSWIYADGSVHRLISDLSALIGQQAGHRIIAAGDFNILHGYGENGSAYWASRYNTVFNRMSALGLPLVGPQIPAGKSAEPWPDELPRTSKNVPTFHHSRQTPATATRQLDFVFASSCLVERVRVAARNEPHQWGPSDHCRVEIELA